jgi:hypothetical protein
MACCGGSDCGVRDEVHHRSREEDQGRVTADRQRLRLANGEMKLESTSDFRRGGKRKAERSCKLEIEPPPDFVRIRIADASLSVIETNSMDR